MIRLAASAVVTVIANAIALIVGALVLDQMELNGVAFVAALLIFSGVEILIEPLLRQLAITSAPALLGGSALVATLVSLIVTTLINDGMQIRGALTWVLAAVLIWVVALVARLLLPYVMFKKILGRVSNNRSAA